MKKRKRGEEREKGSEKRKEKESEEEKGRTLQCLQNVRKCQTALLSTRRGMILCVYTRDLLSQAALYMMHATDAYSNDGDKIHQLANKEINSTSTFFCRSDQADRQIVWRMRMMTARHQ